MGIRTPSATAPSRHHEQTGQPPIFPPLKQRFGFSLGIISRGLVGSKSRKRFESGMGPTHCLGMGHHRIDVTPVEYRANTPAILGAEFGVFKRFEKLQETSGQRSRLRERNFPGIREADSGPRELRWIF